MKTISQRKIFLAIPAVILLLLVIVLGTVWLQKPPPYPTAQTEFSVYFDDYRMDYSVTKPELVEDVDRLVAFTEELHAAPYRVTDRDAFLEKAEAIKSRIQRVGSEEIPVQDAYYDLLELAAFLQDGHTAIYPLNWEKTVDSMLPLTFTSVEGRIFVKDNYGENDVPERAEIIAVNGVSVEQMRNETMKYVPGTLPDFKQAQFSKLLNLFIQTYYKMPAPWQITSRHNGALVTTTVQGITQEAFVKAATLRPEFMESEIEANGQSLPVLTLAFPGFENISEWDDFKTFVDDFFARNMDKPYLIIDARHHHGGDGDWMVYLLSHLTGSLKGFKEFSFRVSPLHQQIIQYGLESTYYDMKIPQFLWGLPIYKWAEQDDPYYWIARGVMETEPGAFYEAQWEDSKPYIADETSARFQGKVFLLTSHETFSAGAYLAGLFWENNLGVIVGRETGGRVSMQSDPMPVFLPNTNLMYLIPVANFVVCSDNPDRGVIPEVAVDLTVEDYTHDRDGDMEQVISLIGTDLAATNARADP
ncbi:MAG: hypothetical protein JXA21_10365 [Anaerolineae bacterium]|nr:hypothetical protein [Anaerolineae bacterium]